MDVVVVAKLLGSFSLLFNSSHWLSTYSYRIMDAFKILCKIITIAMVTAYITKVGMVPKIQFNFIVCLKDVNVIKVMSVY